jgi:hypothetical protein
VDRKDFADATSARPPRPLIFAISLSFVDISLPPRRSLPMAPLADFILAHVPLPKVPYHYTHYVVGKTPMSTPTEVWPTLAAYLVIIFGTQAFMKSRPAFKLQIPFQIHNIFLSAGSLLVLLLIAEEVIPMVWKHGLFWGMCNEGMWLQVRVFSLPCDQHALFALSDVVRSAWSFTI